MACQVIHAQPYLPAAIEHALIPGIENARRIIHMAAQLCNGKKAQQFAGPHGFR
ncbi:Uncharacterised protein [Klebsiella pneumoniae]|nr:Uncharacterised protein [Klebsiella pneumoniae]